MFTEKLYELVKRLLMKLGRTCLLIALVIISTNKQ